MKYEIDIRLDLTITKEYIKKFRRDWLGFVDAHNPLKKHQFSYIFLFFQKEIIKPKTPKQIRKHCFCTFNHSKMIKENQTQRGYANSLSSSSFLLRTLLFFPRFFSLPLQLMIPSLHLALFFFFCLTSVKRHLYHWVVGPTSHEEGRPTQGTSKQSERPQGRGVGTVHQERQDENRPSNKISPL